MSIPVLTFESETSSEPKKLLRPRVGGKFLFVGEEKFYVRGVTYGPFRPTVDGTS